MNYSYTDIQLNTLKTRQYVKNQKMFAQKLFDSSQMTNFYDYYMHDDGLGLDVKHQILQDTIDDWVALRLHFFAPAELFSLNTAQMGQFSRIKHFVDTTPDSDSQHSRFVKSLENIGEHLIDEPSYLDFALRQVVTTAKNLCSTINTVSHAHETKYSQHDNWTHDVNSSNMGERVLERRDQAVSEPPSQGHHHEY